jgi:hypothetical protein
VRSDRDEGAFGKTLVTYVITEEDDPDPAKTRSRHEAAGF